MDVVPGRGGSSANQRGRPARPRRTRCAPTCAVIVASLDIAACAGGEGGWRSAATPAPPPQIAVTPPNGSTGTRLDAPVQVSLDHGTIEAVTVSDRTGARTVPGDFTAGHHTWTASQPLDPGTTYVV